MDVDAVAGEDYNGLNNILIYFAPEQTAVTRTIEIINDQTMEGDELFQVFLHKILGVSDNIDICSNNVTVLIKDDDGMCEFCGCNT